MIHVSGERNGVPVEVDDVQHVVWRTSSRYVNNINTHEGGTHLTGFRRGLTLTLKKYAESSGMLDKLKFDISADDFREGLDRRRQRQGGGTAVPRPDQNQARQRGSFCAGESGRFGYVGGLPRRTPREAKTIVNKVIPLRRPVTLLERRVKWSSARL